jgi:hypothetical protein
VAFCYGFVCYNIVLTYLLYVKFVIVRLCVKINLNNPKGASFKENHLMTTAHDALRTMSILRFSTYTNNLNFLNQSKQFIRIDRNFLFGSFKITSIRLYTPFGNQLCGLHSVYNLIEVIAIERTMNLSKIFS